MDITPKARVSELVDHYPFLLDFLAGYRPELAKLKNPLFRNTMGRLATLENVAGTAGVPVTDLVRDLRAAVLKDIILALHAGEDFAKVKRRFAELAGGATHAEVAAMEQQLIAEGLPAEEVKRLCDVHVAVFKEALDEEAARASAASGPPPGHPVHTFLAENKALAGVIEEVRRELDHLPERVDEARLARLRDLFAKLSEVDRHYLRKENQLFPALEAHGFAGPTKVMWALHDDVRAGLKAFAAALDRGDLPAVKEAGESVLGIMADLIYKEERILFPTALDQLEERDWVRIRQGEDEVGYALVTPGHDWKYSEATQDGSEIMRQRLGGDQSGRPLDRLPLDTGLLSLDQLNLLLRNLPVDISFADEHDEVRYYSEGRRVFPRSPGVIGRKVQNCHPPKSVDKVEAILKAFRAGTQDVAEFWLEQGGRFIHIRYFALRDQERTYRGTLEVVQDVTDIRALKGERRLLDW